MHIPDVLTILREGHVELSPGLTDDEIGAVERRFDFQFCDDHRALLRAALPAGEEAWPDWRAASHSSLRAWFDVPADGVVFDVVNNSFWPSSWGPRPDDDGEASRVARAALGRVPTLVPLYSHRFMPAAPCPSPAPVFSVHQTDVIHYGRDLAGYARREFARSPTDPPPGTAAHVPFWSDLAMGVDDVDL